MQTESSAGSREAASSDDGFTYLVYDTEVTTRSHVGFPASPHFDGNQVVVHGVMTPTRTYIPCYDALTLASILPRAGLIVAANAKFDLMWLARSMGTSPAMAVMGQRVWDVCHVEYLLRRQRIRMPSLEKCCELRGIPMKKMPHVSEQIKAGVCPSKIPLTDLCEYNFVDLDMTREVFLSQFEEAKRRDMLPLIWSQMKALVATAEMEFWGLTVDTTKLDEIGSNLVIEAQSSAAVFWSGIEAMQTFLTRTLGARSKPNGITAIYDMVRAGTPVEEILNSNKLLSLLLFGGVLKSKHRKLVGKYKNGKDKYKTVEVEVDYEGIFDPVMRKLEKGALGYYSVDEKTIDSLLKGASTDVLLILSGLLGYRAANKQLTTYVDGIRKALWPHGMIHCSFNHSVTLTGRLSCSNPNLQNQTDGDIKKVYVPRNSGGYFIEYDYAQLEVIGLAVLSNDPQLIDDLKNGRDVHTALYFDMYGRNPTKEERKAFKPLTFGLIYGAGVNTLAENANVDVNVAKRFVVAFYKRYPMVKVMHENIQADAELGREMTTMKTEKGYPVGKYVHRLVTGREYEFYEYDNDFVFKKGKTSFSPTELKNWQVQGFATGDVVPLVLGEIVEELTASTYYGKIVPVVTVHDSIMFEVLDSSEFTLTEARNFLDGLMSNTRERIVKRFGFDPGLDFAVESKVGYNWKEMA